jgi:exodeoxyribonuclease-3
VRLASWNVNSLNVRLPHVLRWLDANPVEVLALQETKLADAKFPVAELRQAGYEAIYTGQPTYNGVAILSRLPMQEVMSDLPGPADAQRRFIAATIAGIRVINLYVPNGQAVGTDKYAYKLAWLEQLHDFLINELERYPHLLMMGDYNIAPEPRDVHDPDAWEGKVLFSEAERAALRRLLALGLQDSLRLITQEAGIYSWWDYRLNAFKRKLGLRIDLILLSRALAASCRNAYVDKEPRAWERPSDHAPAVVELNP